MNSPFPSPKTLKFFTKISPFLLLIPGEESLISLDETPASGFSSICLNNSAGSFFEDDLFLNENFFLGIKSEVAFSRVSLRSEMDLREERSS